MLQLIRASTGDSTTVTTFTPPASGFDLVLLNGEVELVSKAKLKPGTNIEISSVELSAHLQSRYVGQVRRVPYSAKPIACCTCKSAFYVSSLLKKWCTLERSGWCATVINRVVACRCSLWNNRLCLSSKGPITSSKSAISWC